MFTVPTRASHHVDATLPDKVAIAEFVSSRFMQPIRPFSLHVTGAEEEPTPDRRWEGSGKLEAQLVTIIGVGLRATRKLLLVASSELREESRYGP